MFFAIRWLFEIERRLIIVDFGFVAKRDYDANEQIIDSDCMTISALCQFGANLASKTG